MERRRHHREEVPQDLAAFGTPAEVNIRINSEGWNAYDGFAVYNTLKDFSANGSKVIVTIDAAALLAASIIAMAGDTIRAQENATIMIHTPGRSSWATRPKCASSPIV